MEVFYNMIVLLWVCVARHVQGTQNNRAAISLQYLKKNVEDEVDFSPANKHQGFLQIDTIILGVCGEVCPNCPISKFAMSLKYLKREVRDEVDFLHAHKHQCFLQGDTIIIDVYDQAFSKYSK